MRKLVHVLDRRDETFIAVATIEGLEYIQGNMGWFSSLILKTTDGRRLQGYLYLVRPAVPLLEHVDATA